MFTPKLNTSRSKFSPFPGSRGSAKGRRSVGLFTPQRKTGYATRNQSLNRSLQTSQIVEETAQHRLEAYGTPLPVTVTEALTLSNKNTPINVKLCSSGWAWLVCGRSLFVWRFKSAQLGKSFQCKELSLPPTDLSHQADLVALLPRSDDHNLTSCVAVSPEGVVRYWASVSHEGAFCEVATELKGEECVKLIALESGQCILGTTTSTLVLLTPSIGHNQLTWRMLRAPQGVFAGFGRRMSSFIFGSVATQAANAPLHQLVVGEDEEQVFYALSGGMLYKWELEDEGERLLYQCEIDRMLRECISRTVWGQDIAQLPNLKTWLIDMQSVGDSVIILGAGMNPDISDEICYTLGTLRTEGPNPPQSFMSFSVPKFTNTYQEEEKDQFLSYSLLIPEPTRPNSYLFHTKVILCSSVSSSGQPPDKIEFRSAGDKILGAGRCDGMALFFSSVHGVVAIRETPQTATDISMNESVAEVSSRPELGASFIDRSVLGSVTPSRVHEMSMSEDKTARLKAAFLHHIRGNMDQAQSLVEELFPSNLPPPIEPGSPLDTLVILLSQEMIDDFPASDPRWAESIPHDAGGSSSSLILLHQLEDKLRAHEYLLNFLKSIGLWDRLSCVRVRDAVMTTRLLLCEHAEKLTAAISLRGLHTQHTPLIDRAIRTVLEWRRETAPPSGLTAQDLFYRRVSRIHEIFESLQLLEEEGLKSDISPREVVSLLAKINAIFVGILQDVVKFRESKAPEYQSRESPDPEPEYVPWTASVGPKGLRAFLAKQHMLTVEQALPAAEDASERGALFKQLLELADVLLDGYKVQLETIRQTKGETPHYQEILQKYEQERHNLVQPFMQFQQYERAASLAEKYLDFGMLVQLCETTGNQDRLNRYMTQFQNKGFSDYVFKWYMGEGKRGKLLSSTLASHPQLGRFLQAGENKFLSWLHDVQAGDFFKAHNTLYDLAMDETSSMAKKKTLLSLSKLSALATDAPAPNDLQDRLEAINNEHDLILHQETLPQAVLEALGMDADNMKVIAPKELIELYTSEYNASANEFDFKKALDLLQCLDRNDPETEYDNLLLHIWCQAILRDEWSQIPLEDPLENSKNTVFFKTIELAFTEGLNLRDFLPPEDRLLEAEGLGQLRDNANFLFLIKAGYEQIQRILA